MIGVGTVALDGNTDKLSVFWCHLVQNDVTVTMIVA